MASFYERADGAIEVQIRVRGFPPLNFTRPNKTIARRDAGRVEAEMRAGTWKDSSDADRTLLSAVYERYMVEVAPRRRDHALPRVMKIVVKRWGHYKLTAIKPKEIAEWKVDMLQVKLAGQTVNKFLARLSALYTFAIKEMHIAVDNPVSLVSYAPKTPKKTRRRLKSGEEVKLLQAMDQPHQISRYKYGKTYGRQTYDSEHAPVPLARLAVILSIETGMRETEIASLRRDRLSLDDYVLRTQKTKNGDERDVPLSPRAVEALHEALLLADERVASLEDDDPARQLVFGGLSSVRIWKALRVAADAIGSHDLDFHCLRHEAASRLCKLYNEIELTKVMGWKTTAMAQVYYKPDAIDLAKRLRGQQSQRE
jgi:integrase